MKVAVTGTHGLIAGRLLLALQARGDEVVRLVRSAPGPGELRWDPTGRVLDAPALAGIDAVVHLAGVPILGRRWNRAYKRRILESRSEATAFLAGRLRDVR